MLETNDIETTNTQTPSPAVKRKRGRPKGSKNKPKEVTISYTDDSVAATGAEGVVEFAIPKYIFDRMSGEQIGNLLAMSESAIIRSGNKQAVVLKAAK